MVEWQVKQAIRMKKTVWKDYLRDKSVEEYARCKEQILRIKKMALKVLRNSWKSFEEIIGIHTKDNA